MSLLLASPVALAAVIGGPTAQIEAPSETAAAEIPADLLHVYMGAALTCPGLPWQVLAGIGFVESNHARSQADPQTGQVTPPIIGPAIDGRPGFASIPDASQPDGWAHALGPMQFLSTTWRTWGTVAPDRPPGATPDVHNAWDAIYAAARYLCSGRAEIGDLEDAILRYNRSDTYVRRVLDKSIEYGWGSGVAAGGSLVTGSGEAVVAVAMTQLGVPYVWGGASPQVGFDCSGLVQWSFAQIGVALPRTTQQQINVGVSVSVEELRPGDLIFTRSTRTGGQIVDYGHIAIYAGGGYEIVAPHTGALVRLHLVDPSAVQAARRVLG